MADENTGMFKLSSLFSMILRLRGGQYFSTRWLQSHICEIWWIIFIFCSSSFNLSLNVSHLPSLVHQIILKYNGMMLFQSQRNSFQEIFIFYSSIWIYFVHFYYGDLPKWSYFLTLEKKRACKKLGKMKILFHYFFGLGCWKHYVHLPLSKNAGYTC